MRIPQIILLLALTPHVFAAGSRTAFVIDHTEIKAQGYLTVAQVISQLPALDIDSRFLADVTVWGYGRRPMVLLDGERFVADLALSQELERIPLAIVERIEVFRQGEGARFGESATAGVINIITREDYSAFELNAGQRWTSGRRSVSEGIGSLAMHTDALDTQVGFVGTYLRGLDSDERYKTAMLTGQKDFGNRFSLRVRADARDSVEYTPFDRTPDTAFGLDARLLGRFDSLETSIQFAANYDESVGEAFSTSDDLNYVLNAKVRSPETPVLGKNVDLTVGAEFDTQDFDNFLTSSLYSGISVPISRQFRVDGWFRVSDSDRARDLLTSSRVTAHYAFDENLETWISWKDSVVTPRIQQLAAQTGYNGEEIRGFEVGARYQWDLGDGASVEARAYDYDHRLQLVDVWEDPDFAESDDELCSFFEFCLANPDEGTRERLGPFEFPLRGIDLSASFRDDLGRFGRWESTLRTSWVDNDNVTVNNESTSLRASLYTTWSKGQWSVSWLAKYQSSIDQTGGFGCVAFGGCPQFDASLIHDVHVAYRLSRPDAVLRFGSHNAGRDATSDSVVDGPFGSFVVEPPRVYFAELGFRFD